MKKLLTIVDLSLLWSNISFADNQIILKCKSETQDKIAIIDLDNMSFDMNRLKEGIPKDLRFSIIDVNDERIVAESIKTISKGGGHVKWLITITIDRYLGTIDDSAKKIEDTRTDKSGPSFWLKSFYAENCEKFDVKKKF